MKRLIEELRCERLGCFNHLTPAKRGVALSAVPSSNQPSEGEQIVLFNFLDLYHKSPDAGELQYKSGN